MQHMFVKTNIDLLKFAIHSSKMYLTKEKAMEDELEI